MSLTGGLGSHVQKRNLIAGSDYLGKSSPDREYGKAEVSLRIARIESSQHLISDYGQRGNDPSIQHSPRSFPYGGSLMDCSHGRCFLP